jgi:subtilisin family serine protease
MRIAVPTSSATARGGARLLAAWAALACALALLGPASAAQATAAGPGGEQAEAGRAVADAAAERRRIDPAAREALHFRYGSGTSAARGAPDEAVRTAGAPANDGPAATGAADGSTGEATSGDVVPGSLVVTGDVDAAELLRRLPAPARAALGRTAPVDVADGVVHIRVPPPATDAVRAALAELPGIEDVAAEHVWSYLATPNDWNPVQQWSHARTNAPTAWAIANGSDQRRIAIVDSGIFGTHPELADRILRRDVVQPRAGGGYDVVPGTSADNDSCGVGHGTAVAGVAAAATNNGAGIAGVAWDARLVDIALSTRGSCDPSDVKVVAALGRLADAGYQQSIGGRVDAVTLSLGGREPSGGCPAALQRAIDGVHAQGTVVVAAAGNDGDLAVSVPAMCRNVIAVAATDRDDRRASYSAMARYLDVAAPGGDQGAGVLSTCRPGSMMRCDSSGIAPVTGTSFAAPYVAGAVALLRDVNPRLTPAQIESVLELTAKGGTRHDHELGWGLIDLGAAARHVRDGRAIPAPREHPAVRLAPGSGRTSPAAQAAAVSRAMFGPGQALYAVIARDDDFADALAGSSLAYGIAPLLFGPRQGSLPAETRTELQRTLVPGDPVFLLGGTAALDGRLDSEIRALGLHPVRLFGPTREHTAVAVAEELDALLRMLGQPPAPAIIVATRSNWPDAVAAGSLGGAFGLPILLTERDGLHPATREHLARTSGLRAVYVVGGTGVVGDGAAAAAAAAGRAPARRLAGAARDATAVAVAEELVRQLGPGNRPPYAIAIDLDRADSYAHALSASVVAAGTYSVFVPVRGPAAGERLTRATVTAFCRLGVDGLLAGDTDLLPDALGLQLQQVLDGVRC